MNDVRIENSAQFFLNECDGVGPGIGSETGSRKLERWTRTEQDSLPTPLPSSRPERLLSPVRVLWTEMTANGHARHPART
jgi:hypothetical protein